MTPICDPGGASGLDSVGDRPRQNPDIAWPEPAGGERGAHAVWPDSSSAGTAARGHRLPRQELYLLFSAGDLDFAERRVVAGALSDWEIPALNRPVRIPPSA
jgi:hypothetical protein